MPLHLGAGDWNCVCEAKESTLKACECCRSIGPLLLVSLTGRHLTKRTDLVFGTYGEEILLQWAYMSSFTFPFCTKFSHKFVLWHFSFVHKQSETAKHIKYIRKRSLLAETSWGFNQTHMHSLKNRHLFDSLLLEEFNRWESLLLSWTNKGK